MIIDYNKSCGNIVNIIIIDYSKSYSNTENQYNYFYVIFIF